MIVFPGKRRFTLRKDRDTMAHWCRMLDVRWARGWNNTPKQKVNWSALSIWTRTRHQRYTAAHGSEEK